MTGRSRARLDNQIGGELQYAARRADTIVQRESQSSVPSTTLEKVLFIARERTVNFLLRAGPDAVVYAYEAVFKGMYRDLICSEARNALGNIANDLEAYVRIHAPGKLFKEPNQRPLIIPAAASAA